MTREEIVNSMSLKDAIQVFKDTNTYGTMDIAKAVILKALEQEPLIDQIRAEIDTARFIDRDTKIVKNANASGLEVALHIIDKSKASLIPAADVAPVIHAKWITTSDGICRCTACSNGIGMKNKYYPFCHWCGAKMDLED